MSKFLEKLLNIGSAPLQPALPDVNADFFRVAEAKSTGLLALLGRKNGFYAFESALHVFPSHSVGSEIGLVEWNSPNLWIDAYKGMASGGIFFAEDVFGVQFCMKQDGVHSFDPETARFEFLAHDLEAWAKLVLNDYEFLTGYPLAHEWQRINGELAAGVRLMPKTPFFVGGEFAVENLYAVNAVQGMRFRADMAVQTKDLPEGAQLQWRLSE